MSEDKVTAMLERWWKAGIISASFKDEQEAEIRALIPANVAALVSERDELKRVSRILCHEVREHLFVCGGDVRTHPDAILNTAILQKLEGYVVQVEALLRAASKEGE